MWIALFWLYEALLMVGAVLFAISEVCDHRHPYSGDPLIIKMATIVGMTPMALFALNLVAPVIVVGYVPMKIIEHIRRQRFRPYTP